MAGDKPGQRTRVQTPRLAELVANALRERILNGEIPDGASLPRQEDLMHEFQVSMPSIREAVRILESEGIITVVRGNIGGAVVHAAPVGTAAYTMAMVLQARGVQLSDVALALQELEPLCAALCARRPDRATTAVAELRRLQQETLEARDDIERLSSAARGFHEAIVDECGSETMIVLVGALEAIWTSHATSLAALANDPGGLPEAADLYSDDALDQYAAAHEQIIDAIEAGDASLASSLASEHLAVAAAPSPRTSQVVLASLVRAGGNGRLDDDGVGRRRQDAARAATSP